MSVGFRVRFGIHFVVMKLIANETCQILSPEVFGVRPWNCHLHEIIGGH